MEPIELRFFVSENLIPSSVALLDIVKDKIIEYEQKNNATILTRGLDNGLTIQVVHPDFDIEKPEGTITISMIFEAAANS